MSRSNSVSSQHQMNQNSNHHPVNTSISHAGAMSIHLGNYIISIPKDYAPQSIEEQSSPVKRSGHMKSRSGQWAQDRSRSPPVPIPTTEMSASSIKFELNWIKFVKDAEDDYIRRLSRNDKPQKLSIFEVNQDLFELYLLNVSGRALAKIQYLNLDLKSSMCTDMKIFDNQLGLMPPDSVMMADQLAEIERRRHRRMVHRERKRRETAHFNTQYHEIEAAVVEEEQKFNNTENEQAELTHHFSIIDTQSPQAATIVEEAQQLNIKLEPMEEEQQAVSPKVTQECQQEVEEEEIKEPIQQQLQQEDQVPFQQQILETATPPKPKKKKVLLDSLNDRSEDEDQEDGNRSSPGSPIPETEDEFDREDMAQTADNVNPTQILNTNGLQIQSMEATATLQHIDTPEVPSPELMTPENNNTLNNDQEIPQNVYPNHQLESSLSANQQQYLDHKLEISIDDQSQILSKEQVKDVTVQKIKIGDMTIEDPYMSLNEEGVMMQYDPNALEGTQNNDEMMLSGQGEEHYTLNEVTDPMLDNSNPFREKSVKSYINSPFVQQAAPAIEQCESNILPQSQDITQQQDLGTSNHQPEFSKEASIPSLKEDQDQSVLAEQRNEKNIQIHERSHENTNTTHQFQQVSSQQSIQVDDKTNSMQDLHHHISYEQGEHPLHINEQSMSAITSGRKAKENISGSNSVRAHDIEQPEREVVLRFEVAVGTTPLNLTFDEVSALYEPQTQKADAALGGNTPLDRTVDQMREQLPEISHPAKYDVATGITQREVDVKQDASILMSQKSVNDVALSAFNVSSNSKAQSKSQEPVGGVNSPQPKSLNTSFLDQKARSLTPSRLEVTLTAEPDKPIMVEVRGGEKQFLISALTKHIYDILSQPNRLQILQDENGAVQFGDSEDPNAPGQHLEPIIDSTGKGAFKLGNQNINLRLKTVKKNQELGLPVLQNLGGKNVREIKEEHNQTAPKVLDDTQYAKIGKIEDNSKQDASIFYDNAKIESKSQQLEEQAIAENYSTLQGPLSVENQADNRYSLPEVTASARDNSCFIVIQPAGQINGRPSILSENVMPLTPHSPIQDRNPSPPAPVQQESPPYTKKRVTMMANTEGKINEEQILGSSFEEEIPSVPLSHGTIQQVPSHNRNSAEGSFRKINSGNQMIMKQQEHIRSRPETANFNKAHAAIAADNINPFVQQEEEDANDFKQPQLETPKNQNEEELNVSNADQKSRLETPHADLLDGTPYSNFQNSVPAQLDEYIQQPLHPTIPEQHPNGYFSNESDYMMEMPPDGNNLANGVSSHSNDQYLTPKLAYYDQFPSSSGQIPTINLPTTQQIQQQLLRVQSINDFYSSQYGYSDADQNIEDFILAEGYPLLNFVKEGGRNSISSLKTEIQSSQDKNPRLRVDRSSKPQQILDFNGQSYSHQNTTNASLETPPNAYRIRKVMLPNQPNANSLSQQSQMDHLRKQPPSSQPLLPLSNTLQPNSQNAGALLRKQKTMQSSLKQLPVVKTKKRIFNNTINNITIYSVNGGPANRSIPVSQSHFQTRSLSPLRKKNNIFYTSNFIMNQKKVLEQLQQMNAQTQASTINKGSNNNTLGHLTVEDFAHSGYYSQSPQPKLKNSPYLSDDEYKILHDYYDIQCEPTSMHRGGVPLMKVKRVQRPKNRTFNIFNFPDDPTTNAQLPKALTSLQIFYPHFQPSQADYIARTMASPSKWFDRFNQSTRNLNQTINNLHNQHTRKLRSYSISNLNSQPANTSVNINGGSTALKMRSGSQNSLFLKKNQAKERSGALIERSKIIRGDNSQSPEILINNLTNDLSRSGGNIMNNKSKSKKRINTYSGQESGANSSTITMPPLHKIYTASLGHGALSNMHNSMNNYESSHEKIRMSKKSAGQNGKTLPPRPGNNKKGGIFGSKATGNTKGGETSNNMTTSTISESTRPYQSKNLVPPSGPGHNIGNSPKNNQYVCFGVNIITKSDK